MNVLCSPSEAQNSEFAQILCKPLSYGAYYSGINLMNEIAYIPPPCVDSLSPKYPAVATYYCIPTKSANSIEAHYFMQLLASTDALCYFSSPDRIFTKRPPIYQICDPSFSTGVSLSSDYRLITNTKDYVMSNYQEDDFYPNLGSYALFVYIREHAHRIQSYNWRVLYPEMLDMAARYPAGEIDEAETFTLLCQMTRANKKEY